MSMNHTSSKVEQALARNPPRKHWLDAQDAEASLRGDVGRNGSEEGVGSSHHTSRTHHPNDSGSEGDGDQEEGVVVIKTTEEKLREAERILSTEIFNRNTVPDSFLTWTAAVSFFHIIQALIQFFIAITHNSDRWYWYVSYPNPEDDASARVPELKQVASFSILWLVPFIPLLSGIQHLSNIAFRESFTYYVERHQNPFRWTEYTVSASLMKVIIAQQVGVTDIQLLICIFVLMAVSIQSAATHECVNAKARSENRPQFWRPFWTSWISHLTNWGIFINYYSVYTSRGGPNAGIVWLIVVSQFLLDNSFAILFTLQWKKVWFGKDYMAAEKGFLFLSLAAKTCLTWLTIINVVSHS
ncbi:hypothetical protein ACA910_010253 [Epithemia clementina (nom. ined.)]